MKDRSQKKQFATDPRSDEGNSGKKETEKMFSEPRVTIMPEVILLFRSGDHRAFETIFHTFYAKVKSFIRMLIRDDEQAEDLTQQLFVDLWVGRDRIDPSGNISAYIYTMARNRALTAVKQQLRFDSGGFDYNEESDPTLADDKIIAKETALLIDLTVSAMPEKRRQVYEMSRYEHKSNEEIAKELNISRKVVEKHIRLAINELKKVVRAMNLFL